MGKQNEEPVDAAGCIIILLVKLCFISLFALIAFNAERISTASTFELEAELRKRYLKEKLNNEANLKVQNLRNNVQSPEGEDGEDK